MGDSGPSSLIDSSRFYPIAKRGFMSQLFVSWFLRLKMRSKAVGERSCIFLNEAVQTVTLESGERFQLLGHSLNKAKHQLRLILREANQNFCLIWDFIKHLVNETGQQSYRWSPQSKTHKAMSETYRKHWRLPVTW